MHDRNTMTDEERRLSLEHETDERVDAGTKDLKPQINEFLFPLVPDGMTIKEFEELSCAVFKLMVEAWAKRR